MSRRRREVAKVAEVRAVSRGWWDRRWIAPVVLLAAGMLAYANSFATPLVFDGVTYILENPAIKNFRFWDGDFGGNRPVGFFTFSLNYAIGGFAVWGYHAVNLAIHFAAAWVLYEIV